MMALLPPRPQLSLHDWACLRTELVWVYDHAVPAEYRVFTSRQQRGIWAWYLRRGSVEVRSGSRRLQAKAGQWVFVPRDKYRQEFTPDAEILSVHFYCEWPSGENIFANREGFVLEGRNHPDLERKAKKLERIVHRHFPEADRFYSQAGADYGLFLEFQSLFLNWLAAWYGALVENGARLTRLNAGDDRSLRAARCLNEARLDGEFPRAALLGETGLSEVHLTQLFLRDFGLTPRKYWDRRRLEYGKTCLESGTMPIKELAYRLGFCSDSHFVAWFQKRVRQSPGRYRSEQG